MAVEAPEKVRANGLKTALDIIVSPKEAFESLRVAPTWGWAILIVFVLYAVASWLTTPALLHATQADWPHTVATNPKLAQLSPDEQARYLTFSLKIVGWVWLFSPLLAIIASVIQTIVMLIFKALGKGSATFATIWASAVNIQIPTLAINALVTAVIVMLRGADSFNTPGEIQTALPSLGMLADPAQIKLHAFLSAINPFTLWGLGLTVGAMAIAARMSRGWSWATGVVWLLIAASLITVAAR